MSVIPDTIVNRQRPRINVPEPAECTNFSTVRVTFHGNREVKIAKLDTGADGNFIFPRTVSALKQEPARCEEKEFLIGGAKKVKIIEEVAVRFQILRSNKQTYSETFKETLLVTAPLPGCDMILGVRFCEDHHLLERSKVYAIMQSSRAASDRMAADRRGKDQDDLAIVEKDTKARIAEDRYGEMQAHYGSDCLDGLDSPSIRDYGGTTYTTNGASATTQSLSHSQSSTSTIGPYTATPAACGQTNQQAYTAPFNNPSSATNPTSSQPSPYTYGSSHAIPSTHRQRDGGAQSISHRPATNAWSAQNVQRGNSFNNGGAR